MAQNDGGGGDNGAFVLMGVILGIMALWYFLGDHFKTANIYAKKAEIFAMEIVMVDRIFPDKWEEKIGVAKQIMEIPVEKATFNDHKLLSSNVNYFFRWVWIGLLGWFGWKVYKKNPLQKFTRRMNMKVLAKSEERLWPAIAPVNRIDMIDQPFDKGPWAMSKKPLDFSRLYKLLDEDDKLVKDRAEKLFAAQLGKLWEGPEKLPKVTKALFAAFAAQANGDIKEAKTALDTLASSYTNNGGDPKKMDFSWVPGYLSKYAGTQKVRKIMASHAYVNTVMASMLESAREFGILASAQFIWLKPTNRTLWYILNGVGRRVAFAEISGIYAHWIAEKVAGHPIERPYVIKAVDGLEKALLEVKIEKPDTFV